jgi:hypothetical protein
MSRTISKQQQSVFSISGREIFIPKSLFAKKRKKTWFMHLHLWLWHEAIREAYIMDHQYHIGLLLAMDPMKLTQSEVGLINEILFGNADGIIIGEK